MIYSLPVILSLVVIIVSQGIAQLKKEMTEFEKQKESELSRMKEFHSDEMKKLK